MTWSGQIVRFVQCLRQADIIKNLKIEDLIYVGKGESGFWKFFRFDFRFPVSGVGVLVVGATVDSSEIPLYKQFMYTNWPVYLIYVHMKPWLHIMKPFQISTRCNCPILILSKNIFKFQKPNVLIIFSFGAFPLPNLFDVSRSSFWCFKINWGFCYKNLAAKTTHLQERL